MKISGWSIVLLGVGLVGCTREPASPPLTSGAREAPDVCAAVAGLPASSFIFVTSPRSGEAVKSGFTVKGCSRTWESHIQWALRAQDGKTIAHGDGQGGGVDGPEPFSFTVTYPKSERQIGHLQIYEEGANPDGGPPPPENVIPVVLE